MSTQHLRQSQQLATAALIELFELDTSTINQIYGTSTGGSVYTWTPGILGGASIVFAGVTYTPMPIEAEGWEWNGQGKLPRPKLRVSNLGGVAASLLVANGDLVGATVTRLRVFEDNLDGQANADTTAFFEPDKFIINRLSSATRTQIEWELIAQHDTVTVMLPKRQIIRDTCGQSYRSWNGTAFVQGSCPYTGTAYFDNTGATVSSPALDVCSKQLTTGCQARFGTNGVLPTYAFPGAGVSFATP